MTFFLGFMCGLVIGAVMTHLAGVYMDSMLFKDKETDKPEPPLWMGQKDEENK